MLFTIIKDIFYKNQFSNNATLLDRDRYLLGLTLLTLLPTLLAFLEQAYIAPWPAAYWVMSMLGDDLGEFAYQLMEATIHNNNQLPITTALSPLVLALHLRLAQRTFGRGWGLLMGLVNCYVCFGQISFALVLAHSMLPPSDATPLLVLRFVTVLWALFHVGVYWRKDGLATQQPSHPLLFKGAGQSTLSPIKFFHWWIMLGIAFWLASCWILLESQQTTFSYEVTKLSRISLALGVCSWLVGLFLITLRMRNLGWRWGRWLIAIVVLPPVIKIIAQLFEGLWVVIPLLTEGRAELYEPLQVPLIWISQQILPIASFVYLLLIVVIFLKPAAGYQPIPATEEQPTTAE